MAPITKLCLLDAESQHVGKRTVCWATPKEDDEQGYDEYSL